MAQDWPKKFRELTPPEHAWQHAGARQPELIAGAAQRVDRWIRSGKVAKDQRDEAMLLEAKVDAWAEFVGEAVAELRFCPPHTDQPTSGRNAVRQILRGVHPDPWALGVSPAPAARPSAPAPRAPSSPSAPPSDPVAWAPLEEAGVGLADYDPGNVRRFFKLSEEMLQALVEGAGRRADVLVWLAYAVTGRPSRDGYSSDQSVGEVAQLTGVSTESVRRARRELEDKGLLVIDGRRRVKVRTPTCTRGYPHTDEAHTDEGVPPHTVGVNPTGTRV